MWTPNRNAPSLRRGTINLAHIGHQGIIKTKRLLHSKVWFPNIDTMVKETIRACLPCQAATSGNHPPPEPLKMTETSQFKVISTKLAVHNGKEVQPKVAKPSTLKEQKERPKRNAGRPARFANYLT